MLQSIGWLTVCLRLAIPLLALGLLAATEATTGDDVSAPGSAPTPAASVPAAAPLSLALTFDAELLRDLPGSRRAWAAFETLDATAILDRIDNGGLYTGEPELLGIHGASWTQVSYRLGDLDITCGHRGATAACVRVRVARGLLRSMISQAWRRPLSWPSSGRSRIVRWPAAVRQAHPLWTLPSMEPSDKLQPLFPRPRRIADAPHRTRSISSQVILSV